MQQTKIRRQKKVIKSFGALFVPHLGKTFPLIKPLNQWKGGRIESIQVQKEHLEEREMIEADFSFQMLSYRCSIEWVTTYCNLVEYDRQLYNDDRDAASFVLASESQPSQPQDFQLLSCLVQGVLLRQIYHCLSSHQLDQIGRAHV